MGTIPNPENHIHLVLDNRIPVDKDVKDKEYSHYLGESAYVFQDGNELFTDLFLGKVGINGNRWGMGLDGFEQAVDGANGLKLIIDPDKVVHDSNPDGTGKYPTDYIEKKQDELYGGKVVKVKKYDLDGDGKIDYARAIVHHDTEESKQRYKNALAAGLNETSPTVDALDPTERWDNLNKVKFVNIVMVKDGAYKEYAKIQHICKGTLTSCGNALAASLPNVEKNDGSLIHVLGHNTNMGNDSTPDASKNAPTGQPVVINQTFGSKPEDVTKEGNEQKQTPQTPEVSENEQALRKQIDLLTKQNKELTTDTISNIVSELAPIELFEGNEEAQKAALKVLGDDLGQLKYAKSVISILIPKMIAFYNKSQTGKKEEKKDEKENPAVATLPSFDNSPSTEKQDDVTKFLNNKSLDELFTMNRKLYNRGTNA